ncbi:MAG: methyltransferase [Polymorphobacter sp.]
MIRTILTTALLALAIAAPGVAKPLLPVDLSGRPAEASALDAGRKPAEVLAASGIKAGDIVIDVMPGAGYYSELLGRGVGPKGKVFAIEPPSFLDNPKVLAGWDALVKRQPNVVLVSSLPGAATFPAGLNAAFFHLTYHDLYWSSDKYKYPKMDPAAFNARLFKAMKKGGTVVVIDHVGVAGMDSRAQADKTHRIDPAVVRADFEAAGFKFAGDVPVLKTAGDNPETLVFDPAVRGKTDRFYCRFVKP